MVSMCMRLARPFFRVSFLVMFPELTAGGSGAVTGGRWILITWYWCWFGRIEIVFPLNLP
jgi:hypothetical protein